MGWQVGLTYLSRIPQGLNEEYFNALLDTMAENNLNLLSIQMQGYGYFDPNHDGYAWPVQNPKLNSYLDKNATNSNIKTEFLKQVISRAQTKGIAVELFLNWGIWNNEKIIENYPNAVIQQNSRKKLAGWLHCPDAPDSWQLGLDEVKDLLTFYDHTNVKRYGFERISYNGSNYCHCEYSTKLFQSSSEFQQTKNTSKAFHDWKTKNILQYISEYTSFIKKIRPDIEIGLHSQGKLSWGHDPKKFKQIGIDYLEPHFIQFKTTKNKFTKMMHHLEPNNCDIHFCARNRQFTNYPIWQKTPKIIKKALGWIKNYTGKNLRGILFYNEPAVSEENKKAIYNYLGNFDS